MLFLCILLIWVTDLRWFLQYLSKQSLSQISQNIPYSSSSSQYINSWLSLYVYMDKINRNDLYKTLTFSLSKLGKMRVFF